jgi:hypothetical protein
MSSGEMSLPDSSALSPERERQVSSSLSPHPPLLDCYTQQRTKRSIPSQDSLLPSCSPLSSLQLTVPHLVAPNLKSGRIWFRSRREPLHAV